MACAASRPPGWSLAISRSSCPAPTTASRSISARASATTQQFTEQPGTYWYTLDYRERATGRVSLSADSDAQTQATYEEYVAKYGEDNAEYLMEVMGAWQEHYDRAAFIDMGVGDSSAIEAQTQEDAQQKGWRFERLAGDMVLVRRLLDGDWGDDFAGDPAGPTGHDDLRWRGDRRWAAWRASIG